jgi:hypothetical protein
MTQVSGPRFLAALLFLLLGYFASGGRLAARLTHAADAQLDQLIPREKWTAAGLDKLTAAEQQTLAGDITALVGAGPSAGSAAPVGRDRSQWRKLARRMSRDDVRKLLGEPLRVSVSRFYESWDYLGGTVTFDGKGRVDFWSET